MSALRKLSAIYIAAASAYALAIACSQHPVLAANLKTAGAESVRIGGEVAIAINKNVVQPGWVMAKIEAHNASVRIAEWMKPAPQQQTRTVQVVPHAKPKPHVVVAAHPAQPKKPVVLAHNNTPPAPRVITVPQTQPSLRPEITEPQPPQPIPPQAAPTAAPQVANSTPTKRVEMQLAPEATTPPSSSNDNLAPAPPSASSAAPSPAELARVSNHMRDSLTAEMLANFDLFLYVSKAGNGTLAQRMYVFDKQSNGNLVMLYNWPVSTGRERVEYNSAGARLPSYTPSGYYELDPKRFYTNYRSIQWNQAMPYAMFFNWVHDGNKTGLAIHGATGEDIGLLGMRASAGCVRLAPQNAQLLFKLIREHYKGQVPRFDFDKRTATMANDGLMLHDNGGNLQYADGYKVLVFIENYGGENVVAALF